MSKPLGAIGRSDAQWIRLSQRLRAEMEPVCHRCGDEIDLTLHHRDRMSWTLDHLTPMAEGGDPYDPGNLKPAHRSCNSRGAAEMTNSKRSGRAPEGFVASRVW